MPEANPHLPFSIREATPEDAARVCALLARNHQSAQDVLAAGTRYWLAEDRQGQPVGAIGLECGAGAALLRSAAVLAAWRGQGIGAALTQSALAAAQQAGYRTVYLFSTGAGAYWARLGFRQVAVPELMAALPTAPQVVQYQALGWLPTEVAWRRDLVV